MMNPSISTRMVRMLMGMHVWRLFNANFLDGDTFETRAYDFMKLNQPGGAAAVRESAPKTMKNGFVLYPTPTAGATRPDEEDLQMILLEMEQRLFGIARVNTMQQTLSD